MKFRSTIETISNYFLSKVEMTNKKMQKLLYYAYAWYIVKYNETNNIINILFNEQPEAWIHGPVFPSIYEKFKMYGRDVIPKYTENIELDADLQSFLEEIIAVFGEYDGDQLELMTHNETPWKKARSYLDDKSPSNKKIELVEIYNYYSSL